MLNNKGDDTLTISCVSYNSDKNILESTIASLVSACQFAKSRGVLSYVSLHLIDNGPLSDDLQILKNIKQLFQSDFDLVEIKTGHGNLGYGKGHNLSIFQGSSAYQLIVNPDVIVAQDAIYESLAYMAENKDCGMLVPDGFDENNNRLYLAKREPHFLVLLARLFPALQRLSFFRKQNEVYEYRDTLPVASPLEIKYASGCFMFCRKSILQTVGGFDDRYFMYFEDFDLTKRLSNYGKVIHHPSVKIVHFGGNASRKGLRHIFYFFESYIKFRIACLF